MAPMVAEAESMSRYYGHGLLIESEVTLSLLPLEGEAQTVDLWIRWGDIRPVPPLRPFGSPIAEMEDGDGRLYFSVVRRDETVILRYPEICEFVGDADLRRIVVHLHPEADAGLVSVLASGALLAIRLAVQGDFVLHASCVEVDGEALAFVGASGMGKSTLAALMVGDGYSLVSDDVLRTAIASGDCPFIFSGGIENRLRDRARELAGSVEGAITSETADGRLSLRSRLTKAECLPLRACVIPKPSRGSPELVVQRLGEASALRRLLQFPRVVGWLDPEILRVQFEAAADLASLVPIYEADIPWGPPFETSLPRQIVDSVSRDL